MNSQSGTETNRSRVHVNIFVVTLFLLLIGAGWLIYLVTSTPRPPDPEVEMGLIVVVAIATLMTLLFVIAAGFSSMNLTDSKQPLGLPDGSIRAMIALVLIMVFIIFGIYLFRIVGTPAATFVGQMQNPSSIDPKTYGGRGLISEKVPNQTPLYNVWVLSDVTDDGRRLAQQLITTVGTLVVAVAGFYFGSSAVSSAVTAVQGPTAISNPVIQDVTPKEGSKSNPIDLQIIGTGFRLPRAVRLLRGSEAIVGTEILSSTTKIQCKVMIDKEPDGKWDVIVENEDGKEARLTGVFTIKQA